MEKLLLNAAPEQYHRGRRVIERTKVHATFARSPAHQQLLMERINMATAKKAPAKAPAKKAAAKKAPAKKVVAKKAVTAKSAAKKAAPAKKAAVKKAPAKKRTPNAAFMKALTPSAALAAIVGDKPLPRTDVTKKVWEYIKKHKLQDAVQKRVIVADAKLKEIFGKAKADMFEMTKLVNSHLK
jgi:chromatin remodeling complex protein RSC6